MTTESKNYWRIQLLFQQQGYGLFIAGDGAGMLLFVVTKDSKATVPAKTTLLNFEALQRRGFDLRVEMNSTQEYIGAHEDLIAEGDYYDIS